MKAEEHPSPSPVEDLRVGEQLKQLRQDRSLTLDEVAATTKISRANLQAIEAMAYDRLPADSFTRGQIVLYGALLGIDGGQVADRFFFERDGGKKTRISTLQKSLHKQSLAPKKLAEPAHVSSAAIASILLLLIVCSFTAFCLYFSWNPFAVLTGKAFNSATAPNTLFHPADPATGNGGAHNQLKLQIFFKKDSRILVSIDHKPALEQLYTKGTTALWEAEKQLLLEFFEPDSADLQFNGAPEPFPNEVDGHYRLRLPATASP